MRSPARPKSPIASLPPLYMEQAKRYQADRCVDLVQAVHVGQIRLEAVARNGYPGRSLRDQDLPGIQTIGSWDAERPQGWGLDWHRNEGIELSYLEAGSMPFAVDGCEYTLQAGDLTITRPWQPHRVGNPNVGVGRLYWLILDVDVRRPHQPWKWPAWLVLTREDLDELTDLLRQNERPVWHTGSELRYCFQKIGRSIVECNGRRGVSRLTAFINELFVLLLEVLRESLEPLDPALSTTRRSVEMFLDDLKRPEQLAEEWSVPLMAERCDLGVTRFAALCKEITNVGPMQFLNHQRLEAAAKMLRSKQDLSITDVAFACGFSSSQYFATAFRRALGKSPRDWRNEVGD